MKQHPGADNAVLSKAVVIAEQAGKAVLDIYESKKFATVLKEDNSPLTLADSASHQIISKALSTLTPHWPVLSEEQEKAVTYEERRTWKTFWFVDPLDGTKEFIKRNGEFTVNIALIEENKPILGVVHAPVLGVTYYAKKGEGAFKQENGKKACKIKVNPDTTSGLKVVASRSHQSAEVIQFLNSLGPHECVNMGSSLKFCLVAEGTAHLYPRLLPTMEWDTAAGQCVVEEAGGLVTALSGQIPVLNQSGSRPHLDFMGETLNYNKENLVNPYFIVSSGIKR